MKKLVLICFSLLFLASCSNNDDYLDYYFEFMPIESISIPEEFILGQVYTISYTYYRPTSCHGFHDLYYYAENNQRTVAVINIVFEDTNCEVLTDELLERSFNFKPLDYQTYLFKFWQGEDENGEDIYLTYEIPVVE